MRLRLSRRAYADIASIATELNAVSPSSANRVIARIDDRLRQIQQFPRSAALTDEPGVRYVNAGPYPYLIFYRLTATTVTVLAIWHAARNPKSMPARPR